MVMGVGHSIAFHIDATGEDQTQDVGSREGIWWLPNATANDYLVLMNRGQNSLQLRLSLFDASGKVSIQNLILPPRGMNRLSIRQLVAGAGLAGSYGGMKVSAENHAGSLDTLHVLFEKTAGFSAVMKMFDYDPKTQLKERDYAKTSVWTLRAPMLALSNPDPALAFPPGTVLRPEIFIRNTTAKPVDAALRFNWRTASTIGKALGPALRLRPHETWRIDVAALQDGKTLPLDANWASVIITTNSKPDELMAVAASYDATLRYGAQTPFSDQLSHQWKGGMWEYDPYHNSIITAGNGGTKPTRAAFTIFYNQGTQRYDLEQTLQPDEQMWMDVGKLIGEHLPDKNGKTLPADLTSGSYEFRDLANTGVGTLFEGKVIYDKTYGHVTYGCAACCGYKLNSVLVWFDPLGVPFQGLGYDGVNATDSCSLQNFDVSDSFYGGWSTANTSVATVDHYGTHTGVSVGSTTSSTYGDLQMFLKSWNCPIQRESPGGGANVKPTISSLLPSTGTVGKTLTIVITGSGFSTTLANNTVQAGSGIAVTVVSVSTDGTTINASFAIAPNAPVGSSGVTVTVKASDGSTVPSNSVNFTLVAVAIPTDWTILSEAPLNSGALFFQYVWSSSTGAKADLSTCSVGETVFYPNYPTTPYVWPLPMVQSTQNPTFPPTGRGSDAVSEDTNYPPGSYQQPYSATNPFTATQRWWWSCPYYNNGSPNNFVPDLSIVRKIFKDTDGFWKYQITKSGYTNTVKLPNQ